MVSTNNKHINLKTPIRCDISVTSSNMVFLTSLGTFQNISDASNIQLFPRQNYKRQQSQANGERVVRSEMCRSIIIVFLQINTRVTSK